MRVWPGQPYPLGATWTGLGVNSAIFSAHATRVPDIRRRQLYGHGVHGSYDPKVGHRGRMVH